MLAYDFGPEHPLEPLRLERAVALIQAAAPGTDLIDPGLASLEDLERVHRHDYLLAVQALSSGELLPTGMKQSYGFWGLDNPPFPDMHPAALAYCGASVWAAQAVRDGAPLAFALAGGLHHAMPAKASGFCIYNDVALACAILRERFERVAYVDIDLHHGDGVQAIFEADPAVLTASIHQDGRTIYPGTGFVDEVGSAGTSVNVPIPPAATGDVWLEAFDRGIMAALARFRPEAIVLQMGTDAHFSDPLGHLEVAAQEWLLAVRGIRDMNLPTVACGGGGYSLSAVPRMWMAAVLELCHMPIPETLPEVDGFSIGSTRTFDVELPSPRGRRRAEVQATLERIEHEVLPRLGDLSGA